MELLGMVLAEAIALRIYSLPAAAGSLCAWLVAALAAAVGLWRIRASNTKRGAGARSVVSTLVHDNQEPQASLLPSRAAVDEPQRPVAPAEPATSASEPSTPSKVWFTAYYSGSGDDGVVDGVRKSEDADDDGDDAARRRDCEVKSGMVLRRTVSDPGRRKAMTLATAPWEDREMAVRRRSDLGWYSHIDMAALDGSVVRLWDGDLTAASPRGRMRRAGLELQLSL